MMTKSAFNLTTRGNVQGGTEPSYQGGHSPDDGEGRRLHHLHPLNLSIDQIFHIVKHQP